MSQVLRTLVACSRECPERYPDLIAALYHEFWVEKKGIQLPEVYEPIVTSILGREAASRVIAKVCVASLMCPRPRQRTDNHYSRQSSSEEIKAALKQNTEEAVAIGAPGVPWMRAVNSDGHEESFFGFDHLGQVARFLGLENLRGPHL